jgi:hypothetical protein
VIEFIPFTIVASNLPTYNQTLPSSTVSNSPNIIANPTLGINSSLSARIVPTGNKKLSAGTIGIIINTIPYIIGMLMVFNVYHASTSIVVYDIIGKTLRTSSNVCIVGIHAKP